MKTKTVIAWIIILFCIDQAIKIIIDRYFLDVNFEIIPHLFYFKSTFNDKFSYINGLLNLGMGFWVHIVLFCFAFLLLIAFYDFMKFASGNAKSIDIICIFGFAGAISSLFCTIFWGGCLDYIYLKPLFVFDLKDLYINCFVVLLLIYYIRNKQRLSSVKTKDMVHHFKNRLSRNKAYIHDAGQISNQKKDNGIR